jgi:hypothetical protein
MIVLVHHVLLLHSWAGMYACAAAPGAHVLLLHSWPALLLSTASGLFVTL